MRSEGYSSRSVCLCQFSLLALLGVQREVSAATAQKMQYNLKAVLSKTA